MKVRKLLVRSILERLYEGYFPEPCLVDELCKTLNIDKEDESLKATGCYLKEKGLIIETELLGRQVNWRITPLGIDKLEGGSLI